MTKPITTIEVISTVLGMLKTGAVIIAMVLLEAAKIEKAKAKLAASLAKNDLEIEKVKNEKNTDSDVAVIDKFIAGKMPDGSGNIDPSARN